MSITSLDGKRFAEMIIQGANNLAANAKIVDALNVFPVPDGDTGTNMNLSMTSGAKEVQNHVQAHIGKVGVALSKGLLMGARGNSGVILSQLFRGFSKSIEMNSEINSQEFAQAFEAGVETAYKAVMKPVEGTILTVAKDAAKQAMMSATKHEDLIVVMEEIVKEAKASLNRTPDLLPVLKEVGVVDSGGQGLVLVYEGFLAEMKGEDLPNALDHLPSMDELVSAEHHMNVQSHINTEDIVYGYCTEFMVRLEEAKTIKKPFVEEIFRNELSQLGDSLLVISDDEVVKVHIHSESPGDCMNYGQQYGSLIKLKVENMREQHTAIVGETSATLNVTSKPKVKEKYGIVSISMGSGISELFKSIGATVVIEGGQTMNPSTQDIVKAVEDTNAEKIIILPNNKNIIMAAQQACDLLGDHVVVVPSKTVPQGMSALLAFNPSNGINENAVAMGEALSHVKTGQITYAVRDTNIDGLEIEKGDFMGLSEGKIQIKSNNKLQTAKELLTSMIDEDAEILTILFGEDVTQDEVGQLEKFCNDTFTDVEIEVHSGNQPLYSFIFSIE
ncbi:DAK2 domain-containing protein [Peribacillus loiseleuriae]|uniref:DAK2 domain-containing protein n=1 Tax=Peribacillus loiseleuriae TaxID=1679170 RepID=UPI0037FB37C1